ncbi:MAG: hypothetical protein KJ893_03700 [Candidatus Omnitrophica bacterium]|nr:hypothetical protein [Candidatus Omnitrophota bacterium]MBU4479713.1 hypothetical protein [Candidatus Omnitrophota bacterium]MCG2703496.1 hypothetical protein [Candidatus Omnitrophota bacterium]
MKRIVFRNIDLGSVFKLFAGIGFVMGFIFALFSVGFGNEVLKQQLQNIPYIGTMLGGFFGAIFVGLISALLNGLCVVLIAVLYNIFAMILGGIEMEIDEKK